LRGIAQSCQREQNERRKPDGKFVCLGRIEQTEILKQENYGSPKTQAFAQPPADAPSLQQHHEGAATEHLPAMRGPLRAAPGLPGLWLLQGPPGNHRQSGRLIVFAGADMIRLPRFFLLCELSWM
jgi:hypothetical protein